MTSRTEVALLRYSDAIACLALQVQVRVLSCLLALHSGHADLLMFLCTLQGSCARQLGSGLQAVDAGGVSCPSSNWTGPVQHAHAGTTQASCHWHPEYTAGHIWPAVLVPPADGACGGRSRPGH